ncbi:Nuclear transcription factor Y subunit C-2 [Datura stramonium]|uniref:Nuclear transcription factor Y subunit C-2 n=1 Tax=Datura stramonium TaxID=4076 RepID=A0ABS8WQI3_DATST|nr:Nuclear transcription factor Y subunit C-2 [Datura stramonium]
MENNSHQPAVNAASEATTAHSAGYPTQLPYDHLLEQQQHQLQMFWSYQHQKINQMNDFKNYEFPLARIRKIMKSNRDVHMVSAETPILFSKACEFFILELTLRSWLHAEENKQQTLEKNNITEAIMRDKTFNFLSDIVPGNEIEEEGVGVVPGLVGSTASDVSYSYPPMGQLATPAVMMGRTVVYPSIYIPPPLSPLQDWQSVWKGADDNFYASGVNNGQDNLDGGSCRIEPPRLIGYEIISKLSRHPRV